jgi:hypothetical protein
MKTFIAGGGLGDCILILNKFRQLATPQDKLVYYLAEKQSGSRKIIEEFWTSQNVNHEIQIVPEIARPLNRRDPATQLLNPLIYGVGIIMVERWKFVRYPLDAIATPSLYLESNPSSYQNYFVVQSDAGTMKYRGHKNWQHTEWIDNFITEAQKTGLKCVEVGTKDVGIKRADYVRYNLPLKDLFGIIQGAEFVLGLQGFITIAALLMQKKVLLKRENFRVILNYFHPQWRRHARIFSEPANWPAKKTANLLHWALAK